MFIMALGGVFMYGPLRVLHYFMEHPFKGFYLREVSRKTGLSVFAVKKYCDLLVSEGLLTESRQGNLRVFNANTENKLFRGVKSGLNAEKILKSGLVDFILENTPNTSSITLYGSMAEGLNDEKSDIDLLVIGSKKTQIPEKYAKILGGDINVQTFNWGEWQNKSKKDRPFYNELTTKGISLYGQKPVIP
jgi:hypothetical protein